jgi:hypothetical protein
MTHRIFLVSGGGGSGADNGSSDRNGRRGRSSGDSINDSLLHNGIIMRSRTSSTGGGGVRGGSSSLACLGFSVISLALFSAFIGGLLGANFAEQTLRFGHGQVLLHVDASLPVPQSANFTNVNVVHFKPDTIVWRAHGGRDSEPDDDGTFMCIAPIISSNEAHQNQTHVSYWAVASFQHRWCCGTVFHEPLQYDCHHWGHKGGTGVVVDVDMQPNDAVYSIEQQHHSRRYKRDVKRLEKRALQKLEEQQQKREKEQQQQQQQPPSSSARAQLIEAENNRNSNKVALAMTNLTLPLREKLRRRVRALVDRPPPENLPWRRLRARRNAVFVHWTTKTVDPPAWHSLGVHNTFICFITPLILAVCWPLLFLPLWCCCNNCSCKTTQH